MGRCIGCLLGRPVEGWPGKQIENYLKATDSYPLQDYFLYLPDKINSSERAFHSTAKESVRGNISCMTRDDDIDYTILNLGLIEKNGWEFTTEHVGEEWLLNLPCKMVYGGAHQALLQPGKRS